MFPRSSSVHPWLASCGLLVALPLWASVLPAQVAELGVGTRVRLRAPDVVAGRLTGVVIARGADSLTVTRPDAAPVTLRLGQVTTLDVSRGRSRSQGALKGALWGGGVMAVLGGVMLDGGTTCDASLPNEPCDEWSRAERVAYGAVSGALVGAAIGAFVGSEHWQRLTLPVRVGVAPAGRAGVRVGVAMTW